MDLSLAEKIQILRKRHNLNQGDLGAKAFGTTFESGRTKIKNIELGKQIPTPSDLKKIAGVLGVPDSKFTPQTTEKKARASDICIDRKILGYIPGLDTYMDMLNKAAMLEDIELIDYISDRLSLLFGGHGKSAMPAAAAEHVEGGR